MADKNLLAGGNFFTQHPEHILGVPYSTTSRFKKEITKYKGDLSDLEKIDVKLDFLPEDLSMVDTQTSTIEPSVSEMATDADANENLNKVLKKGKQEEIAAKATRKAKTKNIYLEPTTEPLLSFKEIFEKYNPEISIDELNAFAYWKNEIGQPLGKEWTNSGLIYTPSEAQVKKWVKSQILCYYKSELIPAYIYFAENIYEKRSVLEREKDEIIEIYGEKIYEAQHAKLKEVFDKKYNDRLRLDIPNDPKHPDFSRRLTLLPTSAFAKNFTIKTLVDELPFKIQAVKAKSKKNYDRPDFIAEAEGKGRRYNIEEYKELSLLDAFQYWIVKNPDTRYTGGSSYYEVITVYINQRPRPKDTDKEEWKRIQSRGKENGDRLFMDFLNNALLENDRIRLEILWNEKYNSYVKIDYDKVPVAFRVGKNLRGEPFEMRWEKREAIAFMMSEGSGCVAFGVGYGKTFASIWTTLQFMDAGYCQRPMIVVPNQTYKQWISEIKATAPHIQINDLYNLSQDYLNEVMGGDGIKKVKSNSITLLTYEGFEKIGFKQNTADKLVDKLYEILNQGGESEAAPTGKKGQRKIAAFRERLESLLGRAQAGTMINIEDLGIDFMCVDESHSMKKVFTRIKGEAESEGERGKTQYKIQSGTPSSIALKGFMISHYILENNNHRNVMLLTATPFTNSPLEIFSFLALIAYKKLEESDISNLNKFFDNYIDVSDDLVIDSKLQPIRKQVVKGFRNLPALQEIIYRFINFKDADMPDAKGRTIQITRPEKIVFPYTHRKIDGVTTLLPSEEQASSVIPMSPIQEKLMKDIIQYAEEKMSLGSLCAADEKTGSIDGDVEEENRDTTETEAMDEENLDKEEKAGVIALRAVNFARNLALSPFLFKCSGMGTRPTYKEYIETSNKLKYVTECIRSVKNYHKERKEPISGQIIYMDRGVEYFPLIKEYLVKEVGYAEHEVGIIMSGLPKEGVKSKSHIQNLFLGMEFDGATKTFKDIPDEKRIKIIIGSSTIKEGLNLQKFTTVIYNCFLDWNPTDIVQLEGRGWRQGNIFKNIRIVNPLCENSMDIFIFQKLGEKTDRINQIWNLNGKTSVLRLDEFNPNELKFALVRDPFVIAKLEADDEVIQLRDQIAGNEAEIKTMEGIKANSETVKEGLETLRKEALSVRKSKVKPDSSTDTLIALIMEAIRTQKDDKGKKFENDYRGDNEFSYYSYSNVPGEFDEFKSAYRKLKRDTEKVLKPKKLKESGIDKFIGYLKNENEKISKAVEKVQDEKAIKRRAEEIGREREKMQIKTKPLQQRVKEFEKLNWMLSEKEAIVPPKIEKPDSLPSCPPVDEKGVARIDEQAIQMLDNCIQSLPETKAMYEIAPDVYSDERIALHNKIIAGFLDGKPCIVKGEPIALLTGGVPGSGKSHYLRKNFEWAMSGKVFHIDADAVRTKLPEYKGWNAAVTHRETSDIVKKMLSTIGHPCKYDIVYDGTMNKAKNYLPLIKQIKGMGYKIFIVFVKVPSYEIAIKRAMKRYQKTGRYVPKFVIDEAWENGLNALEELKPLIDGWQVVDGVTGEVLGKGGIDMPKQRDYEVLATHEVEAGDPMTTKPISADGRNRELELAEAEAEAQAQRIRILKLKMGTKKGKGGDIPEIVKRAMIDTITSIGQLSQKEKRDLERYVKKGVLIKGLGGIYPKPKTVYAITGYDIEKARTEGVNKMFEQIQKLEPQNIIKMPMAKGGSAVADGTAEKSTWSIYFRGKYQGLIEASSEKSAIEKYLLKTGKGSYYITQFQEGKLKSWTAEKEKMAKGGGVNSSQYKGKTAEQVWDGWADDQKQHFLEDHFEEVNIFIPSKLSGGEKEYFYSDIIGKKYEFLHDGIQQAIQNHIGAGSYGRGGKITKEKKWDIWKNGESLMDYPIDENMEGETESNGSVQHLIALNDKYYFVQVSWDEGEIGKISEINPAELDEDDELLEKIREFEKNKSKGGSVEKSAKGKKYVVRIEVRGGLADVVKCPKSVDCFVVDRDNIAQGNPYEYEGISYEDADKALEKIKSDYKGFGVKYAIISVEGGVADVYSASSEVEVEIKDLDENLKKGGEAGKTETKKKDDEFFVFNATDGILAYPLPFATEKDAQKFMSEFRNRFAKQGYYLTSRWERIDPQDINLKIIKSMDEITESDLKV